MSILKIIDFMDTKKNKKSMSKIAPLDEIDNIIEKVRLFTINAVKKERYEHSLRVAGTAERLCKKYNLDAKLGKLAGLGHDMCKDFSDEMLLSLASRDGLEMTLLEKIKPALLHGRAAAVKLLRDFNVENADVLEAVAVHTFGKPGMCDLAKVIYVADKIEPGRSHVTKKYLEKLKKLSLDELVIFVLEENISFLEKKGRVVAPVSMETLVYLRGE